MQHIDFAVVTVIAISIILKMVFVYRNRVTSGQDSDLLSLVAAPAQKSVSITNSDVVELVAAVLERKPLCNDVVYKKNQVIFFYKNGTVERLTVDGFKDVTHLYRRAGKQQKTTQPAVQADPTQDWPEPEYNG